MQTEQAREGHHHLRRYLRYSSLIMLTRKGKTEIRNSSSAAVHELADHIGDVERHHTSHKGIPWHQRHIFEGIVRDDVLDAEKAEGYVTQSF